MGIPTASLELQNVITKKTVSEYYCLSIVVGPAYSRTNNKIEMYYITVKSKFHEGHFNARSSLHQ